MDSRIRDEQLVKLSRKIVFICLGSLGSNTQYIEAVHTALVRHRDILTDEPEPRESASDDILWQEIFSLREQLKIAASIVKSYKPDFDDREFLASLGHMDFQEWLDSFEPEPCEDARELVDLFRCQRPGARHGDFMMDDDDAARRIDAYATQASDKRAEELQRVVSAFLSIYNSRQDVTRDDFTFVYQLALSAMGQNK